MFCMRCGAPSPAEACFCSACGQPLGVAPPAAEPLSSDLPFRSMIPLENPQALIAYYLGVFSVVPCLAPVLGVPAVVLGIIGLKRSRELRAGRVHAWIGIVLGSVMLVLACVAVVVFVVATR